MPLPKPLKKGASKTKKAEVVKETMHDLKAGPHHKDRTRKQEIAIAMKESGQAKGAKETAQEAKARIDKSQHRKKRNIGRS